MTVEEIENWIHDTEETLRKDLQRFSRPEERITIRKLIDHISSEIQILKKLLWEHSIHKKPHTMTIVQTYFERVQKEWNEYEDIVFIQGIER